MVGFIIFLALLSVGFVFGRTAEANHFKSLIEREEKLSHITITTTKKLPDGYRSSEFVAGNVVISIDYFKRIAAALRGLVGGRIASYTSLLERARREAVLRMKEEADKEGASMIANVRLETSSVFQDAKQLVGSLEVYAYGTALK
ncbi:MAG: YbjQ family protein [Robiginitomaculum sp.]